MSDFHLYKYDGIDIQCDVAYRGVIEGSGLGLGSECVNTM